MRSTHLSEHKQVDDETMGAKREKIHSLSTYAMYTI